MLAAACAQALRGWLARWGVIVVVAALVASAGAGLDSALASIAALAAWAALPLARGAVMGGVGCLLAVLGVAAVGLLLLAAVRQRLWPTRWREAECALPIAPGEALRAELPWIALAALPWAALQAAGIAVWLGQRPAWLAGNELALVMAGVAASLLTLAGGVAMQRWRRQGGWRVRAIAPRSASPPVRAAPYAAGRLSPWWPLVVWPMRRGMAPRFAGLAAGTLAASAGLAAALAMRPGWAPWWLALQALLVMLALSRARLLVALELRPLLDACAALPLPRRGWLARLDALSAAPALAGAVMAAAVAALVPGVRGAVLVAWVLWLALAALLELRMPVADAAVQSARWLFLLIVALALASEALA